MDTISSFSPTMAAFVPIVSHGTEQYPILLVRASYRHTMTPKQTKTKKRNLKPKITKGECELIVTSNDQMTDLIKSISIKKNLKHFVEVLDLEVISEHGYTSLPSDGLEAGTDAVNKSIIPAENAEFELLNYQEDMVTKGVQIIRQKRLVIYALEMRLGKTHVSLETAKRIEAKKVLFLTPKAAISSIEEDYRTAGHTFELTVTNYEQLKPRFTEINTGKYDLIICDEFHKIGSSFPKPSNKAKMLRDILHDGGQKAIFLSGTPTPESYSQIFHSLYISPSSPFSQYKNFYTWCKDYVNVYTIKLGGRDARQYNRAKEEEIMEKVNPLFLSYSQKEAGFNHEVKDQIHIVEMSDKTYMLAKALKSKKVVNTKDGGKIICETPVKMVSALHQIYSGTIKYEDKNGEETRKCFDQSKLDYIEKEIIGKRDSNNPYPAKTAIFYCFIEEGRALRERFPDSTDSVDKFSSGDYNTLISQVRTVREGVNISDADTIIFYNLGFSYTDYAQARQRHQAKDRESQPVAHFIFSKDGVEQQIYKRVKNKKSFTARYYKS